MKLSTSKLMTIVPNSIIRNVSRKTLIIKKESPHIFFALGVVGTVTSTVLACRATLKLSKTLDDIKEEAATVKEMRENVPNEMIHAQTQAADKHGMSVYSEEEYYKDVIYVYAKSGFKLVKLYAPSVTIGVVSIGLLTGSHIQLARRNSALMVAYAAIQQAFEEYRERVRYQYGEERELDIFHGVTTEVIENADGDKLERKIKDPNGISMYARFFDEFSTNWQKDPELNRIFVQCQQNYANHLLQARGHVFLNEVYDMLGIDRSSAGQVVGWVMNGDGDNYVNFGMFDAYNSAFINGAERSILLDFNVDGVVYDKI
jgi:hypothetical protein